MLYKIDYKTRSGKTGEKFVNNAADRTEAVKRFMDWFFANNPDDAVKPTATMEIEFTGDLSQIDFIDAAIAEKP